ncbi:alanine racemase [Sphingomonas oleivorans]|uniref:Alanine racemase n=1 Tax=Sphingomonas oleivorans TaxID=1735121 RepID=A0A2T5FVR1_9SPHN|nr:alanine racemase [Sphingomonas oleivorans]PTQ09860.1 alanine racemase [Sphingomonas oleivorans]
MLPADPPLRLLLDGDALIRNWRHLARLGGAAACGAAVKADGYGLGAREVVARLAKAGCRDFFVATWAEADALGALPEGAMLSVFHGVRAEDMAAALASPARPVLNSATQVARWKAEASSRPCDVMVDTGMNRLGLTLEEAASGLFDGLVVETLLSHLACADEPDHPLNVRQRDAFRAVRARVPAKRYSLANSAGICLGGDYAHDLTRPGLALYGGAPAPGVEMAQVAMIEAQVLQVRTVAAGATVGYGASFTAQRDMRLAILNLGYADGYLRAFGEQGSVRIAGETRPLVGRISMDLIAVDPGALPIGEGDRISVDYELPHAAAVTGLSQYELLTGLGRRYQRCWS